MESSPLGDPQARIAGEGTPVHRRDVLLVGEQGVEGPGIRASRHARGQRFGAFDVVRRMPLLDVGSGLRIEPGGRVVGDADVEVEATRGARGASDDEGLVTESSQHLDDRR
jgi:hypothetical protein